MRILFCTDGSRISFNALNNFSKWSKGAIVDVICVIDWSFLPDEVSIQEDGFATSCANVADSILDFAEKEISKSNLILGDKIKRCGESVDSIIEQSERESYDLIVVGSHGKRGLRKWLGSVSREVLNESVTSTYISKHQNTAKRILFATDGTDNSMKAVTQAIKYINLNDKKIYICIVLENPNLLFLEGTLDSNWFLEIEHQQNIHAEKVLKNVKTKLEEYNLPVEKSVILSGMPAEKINDFATKEEIDLIVTGTRHKEKSARHFQSSISKRVLDITSADVMIVK